MSPCDFPLDLSGHDVDVIPWWAGPPLDVRGVDGEATPADPAVARSRPSVWCSPWGRVVVVADVRFWLDQLTESRDWQGLRVCRGMVCAVLSHPHRGHAPRADESSGVWAGPSVKNRRHVLRPRPDPTRAPPNQPAVLTVVGPVTR